MKPTKNMNINPIGSENKRCTVCLTDLIFPINIRPSDYKNSKYICKSCKCKKEYIREKKRRATKQIGDSQHIKDLLDGVRKGAKQRSIEFNLKAEDIRPLITERCPILNIKYELNKPNKKWGKKSGQNNWTNSPSVDRIDNTKGYLKDNIIVVSMMANTIKNQATPDQILAVGKFYKKLYEEKGIKYA